ncbi:hypothetical protein [Microcoleus anatoxicus]|uniref:hypothetical protein n=1 Tax=Microcoleus anatoxicus TaxID=2705319 RepID=UPI0030C8E026
MKPTFAISQGINSLADFWVMKQPWVSEPPRTQTKETGFFPESVGYNEKFSQKPGF